MQLCIRWNHSLLAETSPNYHTARVHKRWECATTYTHLYQHFSKMTQQHVTCGHGSIDCKPFGLLVGSCNNFQDTSAVLARKDQDSERGFGSQGCHPRLHSTFLGVSRWLHIMFWVQSIQWRDWRQTTGPGHRWNSWLTNWRAAQLSQVGIDWRIELMIFIHYIRILSSVTMSMCDVLLRHFRII